jgi:hypothetical protein
VPTRWIDQGANQAIYCGSSQSLLSRNYRGGAENHYDKTNWQMLTNNVEQIDLVAERFRKLNPTEVQEYFYSQKMICMRCIILFWNIPPK